ncbi:MAG TPA: hypothetical protein VL979_15080 [Solirubrobacteraceae bacterium]|nr:hypothetical protein [Solirubrobacteraceae bacterium]
MSRETSEARRRSTRAPQGESRTSGETRALARRLRKSAIALAGAIFVLAMTVSASSAMAESTTFTATERVPVPPASHFAGAGGGDGWAVALSETAVYNVFHHQGYLGVSCHLQTNAQRCWSSREYDVITEPVTKEGFYTSGQPGLDLDNHTGKLYVYATRSDGTAGVVCIDTTQPESDEDPFCGFTELTGKGEGQLVGGISGTSDPMLIGTHFYAFSYQNAVGQEGAKNALLCFDVSTGEACLGQPYHVALPSGDVSDGGFPSPATATIAGKAIIPISIEGTSYLTCFDDATSSTCAGAWPVKLNFSYASSNGAPFPLLDATGKTIGLCLPSGSDPCFTLEGNETATPAGMPAVVQASDPWNGPGLVLGPRVYLPNGNVEHVECFDYSTDASCTNFPKGPFTGLGYLYTVNPDPQRPTCIWINADNGADQIQNFDAYTGEACGQGTIRVLASQFVVPQPQCTPAEYISLQVLRPERSTYTTGTLEFDNGDAESIGLPAIELDGTGSASLTHLELNTPTGLPQFLFTLTGEANEIGEVELKLTWRGEYDATCIGEKTEAEEPKPPAQPQPKQETTTTTTTTTTTSTPPAKAEVAAFGEAHLASHEACVASNGYTASVTGSLISSVTFTLNGHKVAKVTKANAHGRYAAHIKVPTGHKSKLVIHVVYSALSKTHTATITKTLARCAAHHHRSMPRFTG